MYTNFRFTFLIFILLVSCTAVTEPAAEINTAVPTRTAAPTPEIAVTKLVVTAGPTATPVVCTPLPPEMLIHITPVSAKSFDVEITGLAPGEILHWIMTRSEPDGQIIIEQTFDGRPADDDGRFTSRETVSDPLPDGRNQWQMQIIHARGVACFTLSLPLETAFVVALSTPMPTPTPSQTATAAMTTAPNATPTPLPLPSPSPSPTPAPPQNQVSDGWDNAPVLSDDGRVVAFISNGWPIPNRADVRPWQQFAAFLFDRNTQQMELVSQTQSGGVPFDNIYQVALSGDGRVLAYYSFDSTITTDDPDPCTADDGDHPCEDLFIYDRQTGQTERIPRGRSSGLGADYTVALSANGRLVAYGEAGNLLLYDRETGTAVPLLTTTDGQPPNGETLAPVMAANSDIAFVSRASNLVPDDTNETYDVFVWGSASGQVSRVSQTSDGTEANGMSGLMLSHEGFSPALDISADGRYIAFTASATSLTNEPLAECLEHFRPDLRPCFNIYLHDRQTGETRLMTNGTADSTAPTLSGDGRFLGFTTIATNMVDTTACFEQLSAYCWQILLLDTQTGELTLVSRGLDGLPTVGNNWSPQLSADGRVLAFASDAATYTPYDVAHNSDIYLYDRDSGQIEVPGGSGD